VTRPTAGNATCSATRPRCQELHPDESPSPSAPERGGARPQSNEVEGPRESRTCVLGDQVDLWVVQSAGPRAGEEYQLALCQLRIGDSVRGSPTHRDGDMGACVHSGSGLQVGAYHDKRFPHALGSLLGALVDQLMGRFLGVTSNKSMPISKVHKTLRVGQEHRPPVLDEINGVHHGGG